MTTIQMLEGKMIISDALRQQSLAKQFYEMSMSCLDSGEYLCESMISDDFPADFGRGLVVMSIAHHGIELFLKGAICESTGSHPKGHNLRSLMAEYQKAPCGPDVKIDVPFGYDDPSQPDLWEDDVNRHFSSLHQRLKYPTDRAGNAWPGVEGFYPELMKSDIKKVKAQAIKAWAHINEKL